MVFLHNLKNPIYKVGKEIIGVILENILFKEVVVCSRKDYLRISSQNSTKRIILLGIYVSVGNLQAVKDLRCCNFLFID